MESSLYQLDIRKYLLRLTLLAVVYFAAGAVGLRLAMVGSLVTLVWMPTGIAVAALFRFGWRYWPGVWLGAFVVNVMVSGDPAIAFLISVGNTIAPLAAAYALKRWKFNPDIASARDILVFVVVAALLSMMLSASGGALSLWARKSIQLTEVGYAWFTWWLGDVVGVILCGMALITYRHANYRQMLRSNVRGRLFASIFWLIVVSLAWVYVPPVPLGQILSLTFPVGVLVWIAFRLGPSPAAFAVLILSMVGAWSLVLGSGPFADNTLYLGITKFWAYMNTVAIVALLVSALNAERHKAHQNLVRSEERFRSLTALSSDWFWEQDSEFKFVHVEGDSAYQGSLIYAEELGRTRWDTPAENLTAGDWAAHKAVVQAHLPFYDFEIKRRITSGVERWASVSGAPIRDERGRFLGYRGIGKDITARKLAEASVMRLAHYDTLTGLPNRAMFMDQMTQLMARSHRNGTPLVLLLLDIDHFKSINDSMGHDQGDRLLVQAAQRLTSCMRQSDTVARLGGDEFIVILSDINGNQSIEGEAQKVLDAMSAPFALVAGAGFVSASVGIARYPDDATTIDDLLKAADQAMYAAKDAGRNRFSFYTKELHQLAQHRLWLIREMHAALKNGDFWVAYQPIIDLATGRCHKAEALLRWQHPERGLISPNEFIPVAESCGLITSIGDWVFEQASHQVQSWRTGIDPDFQISINKSPLQFSSADGSAVPWAVRLKDMGLPGNSVVAEITEGLLLDGNPVVVSTLKALEQAGVEIALDDFGTGYSSLAYLQKYEIDYLKIDQAFVRNLTEGSKDLALCEAIIVMAHKLGLRVVAEGVETQQQRDLLQATGCDFAQGYFFSKPICAQELESYLRCMGDAKKEGSN